MSAPNFLDLMERELASIYDNLERIRNNLDSPSSGGYSLFQALRDMDAVLERLRGPEPRAPLESGCTCGCGCPPPECDAHDWSRAHRAS